LTQDKLAAVAAKFNHPLARYAVTVEVTIHAWNADEAARVVRGSLSNVFTGSEYKMGNVHAADNEPPSDETWSHALNCAGALG
jgi:hypothetical protein